MASKKFWIIVHEGTLGFATYNKHNSEHDAIEEAKHLGKRFRNHSYIVLEATFRYTEIETKTVKETLEKYV